MTNTIRVRKNRTVRDTSKQPKNAAPAAPAHPSFLAIVDRESGDVVKEVPITNEEFYSITVRAAAAGSGPADYLAHIVFEKLNPPAAALNELEMFTEQSHALLELLAAKFEGMEFEGGMNHDQLARFAAGIRHLVDLTQEGLEAAVRSLCIAIHGVKGAAV